MLWLYSAYLESNRPAATDSFTYGPMLIDLEYAANHCIFPLRDFSMAARGDIFLNTP